MRGARTEYSALVHLPCGVLSEPVAPPYLAVSRCVFLGY